MGHSCKSAGADVEWGGQVVAQHCSWQGRLDVGNVDHHARSEAEPPIYLEVFSIRPFSRGAIAVICVGGSVHVASRFPIEVRQAENVFPDREDCPRECHLGHHRCWTSQLSFKTEVTMSSVPSIWLIEKWPCCEGVRDKWKKACETYSE